MSKPPKKIEPKPELKYSDKYNEFIQKRVKDPLHNLENFKVGKIKISDIPKFLLNDSKWHRKKNSKTSNTA